MAKDFFLIITIIKSNVVYPRNNGITLLALFPVSIEVISSWK